MILADGTTAAMEKFLVKVKWHEEQRSVSALRTDGDLISRMFLLLGSRITIDVVENGDVMINIHLLIL